MPNQPPAKTYFGRSVAIWKQLPTSVVAFGLHVLTPERAREVAADLLAAAAEADHV